MADVTIDRNDVVVRLSGLEALAACRRELRVPLDRLRMVQVEQEPLKRLARWRMPGVCWPGTLVVGTGRQRGQREFAAAHARQPAVVLDVEGGPWDRVVVSCPDAVILAAQLAALVLERGPRGGGHRRPGLDGGGTLERSRRNPLAYPGTSSTPPHKAHSTIWARGRSSGADRSATTGARRRARRGPSGAPARA